jgi:pimeloyl-ACP methyl ester carboxylesterase
VITYDRRGNSRSPLYHDPVKITIAGQSADAVAVLRASGFNSARIFGNSGGAIIALDLAAHHPHAVDVVVAHEPPLPRVLPDASQYLDVYDEIDRTLRAEGWEAAFTIFQSGSATCRPANFRRPWRSCCVSGPCLRPGRTGISCSG